MEERIKVVNKYQRFMIVLMKCLIVVCYILLFALKRADNLGQNPEKTAVVLEELTIIEELYKKHMLRFDNLQINGSKLVELGYSGKRIKLILEDVTKMIVTEKLNNDEQAIIEYISRRHKI